MLRKQRPSCITNADVTTLKWGDGRFSNTIPLDRDKNVPVMFTKSGVTKFTAFAATVVDLAPAVQSFVAMGAPQSPSLPSPSAVVTNDEASDAKSTDSTEIDEDEQTNLVDFEAHPDVSGLSVEKDVPLDNVKDELYRIHVRAGHLSFTKIRAMARRGEVPKRLATCKAPMCAACQFGKATHKPWRTKSKNRKIHSATTPGACVSVDQMESRVVGFVAQLKGRLTTGRYRVATIFVDHYSQLGYVHLQKDSSSKETLRAKDAFEIYARDRGVRVQHYHADNGHFVDNAWKEGLAQEN
jgi:hypothetical protein